MHDELSLTLQTDFYICHARLVWDRITLMLQREQSILALSTKLLCTNSQTG